MNNRMKMESLHMEVLVSDECLPVTMMVVIMRTMTVMVILMLMMAVIMIMTISNFTQDQSEKNRSCFL